MVARLSKRAAYLLMSGVGEDLALPGAMRHAQVLALGGSEQLARYFAGSRAIVSFSNDYLWVPLMEMAVAAESAGRLDLAKLDLIVDHLFHLFDTQPGVRHRLKGKSLSLLCREASNAFAGLIELAKTYGMDCDRRSLLDPRVRAKLMGFLRSTWDPLPGVGEFCRKGSGMEWLVVEICSQYGLSIESKLMRHCVVSYSGYCRRGGSAIFSLRTRAPNGTVKRRLTIEVWAKPRRLLQVRGADNRYADGEEWGIVKEWARENAIEF